MVSRHLGRQALQRPPTPRFPRLGAVDAGSAPPWVMVGESQSSLRWPQRSHPEVGPTPAGRLGSSCCQRSKSKEA